MPARRRKRSFLLADASASTYGRDDFLDWFEAGNSDALAERLCEKYQVNGQTAWSLLKKAENFDVQVVTSLDESQTRKMRIRKIENLQRNI